MAQTEETTLPRVVADRLLYVPDYQRPYAWGRKQLEDLWEDLDLTGNRTHYAGTLVLRDRWDGRPFGRRRRMVETDDEGNQLRHSEIVDGQQRLTTCFLILDRIRRRLEALAAAGTGEGEPIARNIGSRYGLVTIDKVKRPRLELGADLADYWRSSVLGDEAFPHDLIAAQQRLKDAVEFAEGRLDQLTEPAHPHEQFRRLAELHIRITTRLTFLVYEVEGEGDEAIIFETLNERGRDLTSLEKTKNYLLYVSRLIQDDRSTDLARTINKCWSDIFRQKVDDETLLRSHWIATHEPDRNKWHGVDSIKATFDRSKYAAEETRIVPPPGSSQDQAATWDQLYADVSTYVRSLRDSAVYLAEFADPHAPYTAFSSDIDRAAARSNAAALRRSRIIAPYIPLLLAARLAYPSDGALYATLLNLAECYSARVFIIQQRRSNTGHPALRRLAYKLHNGTAPDDVLDEMRGLVWWHAPDHRVRQTMESTEEIWWPRRGHKYVLYEYERDLLGPNQEGLQPLSSFTQSTGGGDRTTEHILPRQPGADAKCWWDHFSHEEHARLVHALGNLVLTYDNSSYGRKCFREKRGHHFVAGEAPVRCYAQGKLRQEQLLAAFGDWTPARIQERQLVLAQWAMQRWSVSPSGHPHEVDTEDDIEEEGTVEDQAFLDEADSA